MTTTLDAYQEAALRSARGADGNLPTREYLALGLCSESGEVAGLVKKFARHGKPFSADDVADELGDVLWYAATLATVCGLSLSDVADRNIAKLRARYRDGFVPAGGGADADRAAAARMPVDHSADAGKMVAPADHAVGGAAMVEPAPLLPAGEHQAIQTPRPMDDGVRCGEWDGNILRYTHTSRFPQPIAAAAYDNGTWWAWDIDKPLGGTPNGDNGTATPPTLEAARAAADAWLLSQHPRAFDDRETT